MPGPSLFIPCRSSDRLQLPCQQAEQSYKKNPKLLQQLQYCEDHGVPFAVILGESELQRGIVKLRHVATREETEVQRDQLVEVLRSKLAALG